MAVLPLTAALNGSVTLTAARLVGRLPDKANFGALINFTRRVALAQPLKPWVMFPGANLRASAIPNTITAKFNGAAAMRLGVIAQRSMARATLRPAAVLRANPTTNAAKLGAVVNAALKAQARMVLQAGAGLGGNNFTQWLFFADLPIGAPLSGEGIMRADEVAGVLLTSDLVWPQIDLKAGEELVYLWNPSGLDKTLANVEGQRLLPIYAELVRDQWDAYAISQTNLPFLAWAKGVNLWEDDWSVSFRRYWTDIQWYMKYERGSLVGVKDFLAAVSGELRKWWVPPSAFYPGRPLTDEEYQAFLDKFPQLRLFPFAPRPSLPWLCFFGTLADVNHVPEPNPNGSYFGPTGFFAPTNEDEGGRFMQTAELVEPDGTVTELTVQDYVIVDPETDHVTTYSQILLPPQVGTIYYADEAKFLMSQYLGGDTRVQNQQGIFTGTKAHTDAMLVSVPKVTDLAVQQSKLQYQTILPGLDPILAKPRLVMEVAPIRFGEYYCGQPWTNVFLPDSIAWQYIYQLWYLFDPNIIPDYHQASTFLNNCRFGQPPYTAELLVAAFEHWPPSYIYCGGFLEGYLTPPDRRTIDKLCRAVRAGQALRDTITIDTRALRMIQVGDTVTADGTYAVSEMIDA